MRTEMINGIPVPYDLSVDELEALLISGDMSDFAVACEALLVSTRLRFPKKLCYRRYRNICLI